MTYKEKIVDALTGEITWRDYTDEEIAEVEAKLAQLKLIEKAEAEKIEAKTALLNRLGITEAEAKLLLS